eukprot:CAMPEP_0118632190 /NCGR_PEP_ID=MMETSP0785-20121206/308_1 /TAXON_ID=91992 /ORGANISM="Bolidomonas pacifica, Strain CCMP 1866" /LENGTH=52 /DNA_ID=CAMNT_0006522935 /DNA_START=58 /DNA_END=213 /DNA_ORIENTATION=-
MDFAKVPDLASLPMQGFPLTTSILSPPLTPVLPAMQVISWTSDIRLSATLRW